MLCSNDGETVKKSIESLSPLTKELNPEIVVVDNKSTDGSWETMEALDLPNLKLLRERCTRGRGRQLGFEKSTGDYIIADMDCDDIFNPSGVTAVARRYLEDHDGRMLVTMKPTWYSNLTIAPRPVIDEIGGWRDVNWWEDWDIWVRAAAKGLYEFMPYPQDNPPHSHVMVRRDRTSNRYNRVRTRYEQYRDALRIGKAVFRDGERILWNQRAVYLLARANVWVGSSKLKPSPDPLFEPLTP
jgi:glycosyltransferase involved in cell wall biosynthesis